MATELKNNEDTDIADCDGEKVVTMMDVLQEQEDFEEDANAVLGASDEKDCTYSKGYIKRQAIYACMTCCSDAKIDPSKRAGVCLACSLNCHENHELIELYTKRNFKCDCGNPKFNSHPCQYTPDKTDLNEENNYNQNFSGLYCVCQRPYPDPESTTDVEMIQCIICEDWLHASHLEATVPDNDQYSEMICKACLEKNEFLHDYGNLAVTVDVNFVTNGIDYGNMCNGNIKVDSTEKDEAENMVDVEISENTNIQTSDNMSKTDDNTDKLNGDVPQELSNEKNGEEKYLEAQTESKESEPLNMDVSTENTLKDTTEDDTVKEISGETEKDVDTKTVNEDQENKEPPSDATQTENASVLENTDSIKKSVEQLEEDRLLADPDDDSKKTKEEEKIEANVQNSEVTQAEKDNKSDETNDNMAGKENSEPANDDKMNESRNNEDSSEVVGENQVDENTAVTNSNIEDNTVTAEDVTKEDLEANSSKNEHDNETMEATVVIKNEDAEVKVSEKRKLSTEENNDLATKKAKVEENNEVCVRPKGVHKIHKGATFWPTTFRQKLCTCRECITMYKDLSVLFLIDPEDTVSAYENLGKQKTNGMPSSQYEKGLQALSSLDRIQQINALTEYNKMRDKLLDFLKSFKDRREVVKEEDIKAFFAGMKPKREPDGVYFCR